VHARIEELREIRIEGVPTVGEFMERRLAPAMNTCESIARRQQALAERIAHSNDLLRTRVGIVQEQQNRKILQSLNARAAQQLRLQQAVKGCRWWRSLTIWLDYFITQARRCKPAAGRSIQTSRPVC